jgi:hypothetical protein
MDELTRAFDFERRWFERCSTRLERFEFGVAYLDEEYRQRYFSNFLLADKRLDEASAEALLEAGEGILGRAGYEHRLIILRDERRAERFAPAFQAAGFSTSREVTMTHRRDPDRDADLPVEEVPFSVVRPVIQEMYREDPHVPDDIALLFADQHGKYERVAGARFFAARVDGRWRGTANCTKTGTMHRSSTLARSSSSAAGASLARSSFERSGPRGRTARGTSSSSPTKTTGHGTCTRDSASIGSDAPGSSSGRPMAAKASSDKLGFRAERRRPHGGADPALRGAAGA